MPLFRLVFTLFAMRQPLGITGPKSLLQAAAVANDNIQYGMTCHLPLYTPLGGPSCTRK